jgi:hypothetical protein
VLAIVEKEVKQEELPREDDDFIKYLVKKDHN